MMQFTLITPAGANYTPAGLMHEYAKAGRMPFLHTWHGTGVIVNGRMYLYDHWNVKQNNDGTETVTVFLEED